MTVAKIISNERDRLSHNITYTELGKVVGVNRTTISNFLEEKTELGFESVLKIVRYIAPDREEQLMKKICLEFIGPCKNLLAMEYLATTRNFEELGIVIKKCAKYENQNIRKWSKIYQILYELETSTKTNEEILNKIYREGVSNDAMCVLLKIIRARVHSKESEFYAMFKLAKVIDEDISRLPKGYLRESFTMRLYELLAYTYLFHLDKPKKSRYYAKRAIEISCCAKMSAHSYYIIGMSHVFDNPIESINYLEKFKEVLLFSGEHDTAEALESRDISFAKIVGGIDLDTLKTNDISERAHYEAMWGDKKKAIKLIKTAIKAQGKSSFRLYYEGLATNNEEILLKSLTSFMNEGNKFFANLPRKLLSENEAYAKIADMIFDNIKIA